MVCIYEGVGIMTLGLTKIEYSRLQKRMIISEKQRRNNPQEIPSFTEMEIVAAIQSGMSSPEIRNKEERKRRLFCEGRVC
jgi:hypothetical protein